MEVKDVLVFCDVGRTTESRIDTAIELASYYNALVTAVFIPPSLQYNAVGFEAHASLLMPIDEQIKRNKKVIDSTKSTFITKAEKSGISYEWVEDDDIDIETFISHSRYSDIAIAPQYFVEHIPNDKTRITDYA